MNFAAATPTRDTDIGTPPRSITIEGGEVSCAGGGYREPAQVLRSPLALTYRRPLAKDRHLLDVFFVCWFVLILGVLSEASFFLMLAVAVNVAFFMARARFGRVSIRVSERALTIEEGWMVSHSGRTARTIVPTTGVGRLFVETVRRTRRINGNIVRIDVHHLSALMSDGTRRRLVFDLHRAEDARFLEKAISAYLNL